VRIIVEARPTYRDPGGTRRYLTPHSAYVAWAKRLIFAHCDCDTDPDTIPPLPQCALHRRLFEAEAWACDACGTPDSDTEGAACLTCMRGGRCTVRTRVPNNERYLRVRDRLVRWLKWRARREST
jgi:hypothetical protein